MSKTKLTVVLGPVPCRECGRSVVWDGAYWTFQGTRIVHVRATCPARYSESGKRKG
jgi:hypothetical protein